MIALKEKVPNSSKFKNLIIIVFTRNETATLLLIRYIWPCYRPHPIAIHARARIRYPTRTRDGSFSHEIFKWFKFFRKAFSKSCSHILTALSQLFLINAWTPAWDGCMNLIDQIIWAIKYLMNWFNFSSFRKFNLRVEIVKVWKNATWWRAKRGWRAVW